MRCVVCLNWRRRPVYRLARQGRRERASAAKSWRMPVVTVQVDFVMLTFKLAHNLREHRLSPIMSSHGDSLWSLRAKRSNPWRTQNQEIVDRHTPAGLPITERNFRRESYLWCQSRDIRHPASHCPGCQEMRNYPSNSAECVPARTKLMVLSSIW